MKMRESEFLDWIASRSNFDVACVPVGPGDDCAVVNVGGAKLLITTDQVLDGVHFSLVDHGPAAAGRKAMARNLSDVAAMAGGPIGAVASVALPAGFAEADAKAVYLGLREIGDEFSCPVVGGDVGVWAGRGDKLAVSVTIFACPGGAKGDIQPVLRSGAKVSDAVCVTGRLGGAWLTDRHLSFTPRVREAQAMAGRYDVRAMIDISDGLGCDLGRLCRSSGVGAELMAEAIPVHDDAKAGRDITPLRAALEDGEDYELLFTLPADQAPRLCEDKDIPVEITRIGTVTAETSLILLNADGSREPLGSGGWEHKT